MKTINWMLVCLCLIAGSSLIFYAPIHLYDLITGTRAVGFFLEWPLVRVLTEPFYAFSHYALTLDRSFYQPAIISWVAWIVAAIFIYCGIKKRTVGRFFVKMLYGVMLIASLFILVALVPLPGPKLVKPDGYVAFDPHSHTVSSHDNVASAASSLRFHSFHGYDFFFVTEHNHTNGFDKFPDYAKYKKVFPGIQMATRDKISVLLLSSKDFSGEEYEKKTAKEIIELAHQNNMLVIMPHWWKWHKFTFEELKELGIDGFEIYNCGYRNFDKEEQREMIEFAKNNNLLMVGSTDWHGWGYMSDVWTVFKGDIHTDLKEQLAAKPQTKVILYREEQSRSFLRFVFEPFMFFYYYIKNADLLAVLSFMVWFGIIFTIVTSRAIKTIKKHLPVVMAALCGLATVYFYILYLPVQGVNQIIPASVIPVLLASCVLWIVVWRINGKNIQ